MKQDYLLLAAVMFPVIAGVTELIISKKINNRKTNLLFVFAALAAELAMVFVCVSGGERSLMLWQLTDSLQIMFKVDTTGRLFAALCAAMWTLVGVFAFEYMKHEHDEGRFFGYYLIVEGTLIALSFAGNLCTFYIFFEAMTFTSLPLVIHELHKAAIMAGLKYMFYSVAGAFMALFGVFFLAGFGGTAEFAAGGMLDVAAVARNQNLMLASVFLMIIGFGTKAGMFPMHGWLPTAHPEAPAPASAVLSGVITKMGVLAIIRVVYFTVGPDLLRGTWVQYAWLSLTLITVFMGSMLAYREKIMKKRLAYSTVSQVSYVLFGLALLNKTAFIGALCHVVFHSLVKNTLFCSAGAIIYRTGKTMVADLKAIGKEMPVVIWCFTLVSLTLVGIPPTSGFVSKWFLATGALQSAAGVFAWLGPVILLVSALLTAGYLLTITINGFFPGSDFDYSSLQNREPNMLMTVPMIIMTAGAVLFGIFPGFITAIAEAIASVVL